MAGDWIKMRGNLWDDPRVSSICDMTDHGEAAVIGGLYWLWATADQHTERGLMPGLTLRQIDRKTGVAGLAAALVAIGWIKEEPQGILICNFEEHNGASAKRRSADAQRKQGARAGEPPKRNYIAATMRAKVFAMDGYKCVYCARHKDDPVPPNRDPSDFALSVDHLTPVAQGGDNSEDNLVTCCRSCNLAKSDRTPEEWGFVPNLSERNRTNIGQKTPNVGAREEKRREEKSYSEAKASGADAPAESVSDLSKDELWAAGKSLLQQGGMPAKQCGSFVGKLVKDYDTETVVEAVRAAVVERPADAAGYLKATCQRIAGDRKPERPMTFAEIDELARRRKWEEMTGRKWPTSGDVIEMETNEKRIAV